MEVMNLRVGESNLNIRTIDVPDPLVIERELSLALSEVLENLELDESNPFPGHLSGQELDFHIDDISIDLPQVNLDGVRDEFPKMLRKYLSKALRNALRETLELLPPVAGESAGNEYSTLTNETESFEALLAQNSDPAKQLIQWFYKENKLGSRDKSIDGSQQTAGEGVSSHRRLLALPRVRRALLRQLPMDSYRKFIEQLDRDFLPLALRIGLQEEAKPLWDWLLYLASEPFSPSSHMFACLELVVDLQAWRDKLSKPLPGDSIVKLSQELASELLRQLLVKLKTPRAISSSELSALIRLQRFTKTQQMTPEAISTLFEIADRFNLKMRGEVVKRYCEKLRNNLSAWHQRLTSLSPASPSQKTLEQLIDYLSPQSILQPKLLALSELLMESTSAKSLSAEVQKRLQQVARLLKLQAETTRVQPQEKSVALKPSVELHTLDLENTALDSPDLHGSDLKCSDLDSPDLYSTDLYALQQVAELRAKILHLQQVLGHELVFPWQLNKQLQDLNLYFNRAIGFMPSQLEKLTRLIDDLQTELQAGIRPAEKRWLKQFYDLSDFQKNKTELSVLTARGNELIRSEIASHLVRRGLLPAELNTMLQTCLMAPKDHESIGSATIVKIAQLITAFEEQSPKSITVDEQCFIDRQLHIYTCLKLLHRLQQALREIALEQKNKTPKSIFVRHQRAKSNTEYKIKAVLIQQATICLLLQHLPESGWINFAQYASVVNALLKTLVVLKEHGASFDLLQAEEIQSKTLTEITDQLEQHSESLKQAYLRAWEAYVDDLPLEDYTPLKDQVTDIFKLERQISIELHQAFAEMLPRVVARRLSTHRVLLYRVLSQLQQLTSYTRFTMIFDSKPGTTSELRSPVEWAHLVNPDNSMHSNNLDSVINSEEDNSINSDDLDKPFKFIDSGNIDNSMDTVDLNGEDTSDKPSKSFHSNSIDKSVNAVDWGDSAKVGHPEKSSNLLNSDSLNKSTLTKLENSEVSLNVEKPSNPLQNIKPLMEVKLQQAKLDLWQSWLEPTGQNTSARYLQTLARRHWPQRLITKLQSVFEGLRTNKQSLANNAQNIHGLEAIIKTLCSGQNLPNLTGLIEQLDIPLEAKRMLRAIVQEAQELGQEWAQAYGIPEHVNELGKMQQQLHRTACQTTEPLIAIDGGLVLIWPFLQQWFTRLQLLTPEQQSFLGPEQQQKAAALLQLVSGIDFFREDFISEEGDCFFPVMANLLCGLPSNTPAVASGLSNDEMDSAFALVDAVIQHWQALKSIDRRAFQSLFLQRRAECIDQGMSWQVSVTKNAADVLLRKLPWSLSLVSLPWLSNCADSTEDNAKPENNAKPLSTPKLIYVNWESGYSL